MSFASFVLAAAVAAQAAAAHHAVDPAQARAAGYAQAQQALAGSGDGQTMLDAGPAPVLEPTISASSATAPAQPGGAAHPLALTCLGGGTANKVSVASAWGFGSFSGVAGGHAFSGSTSSNAIALGTRQQGFSDQADIQLFGGDDRIRLPRTMLPTFHGGQKGWFKLKDVVADARSIRANVAVFAFHSPKVYIDRVTGTISISGKDGDYVGQCQAMREDAVARF
jgi:hypothetical protein